MHNLSLAFYLFFFYSLSISSLFLSPCSFLSPTRFFRSLALLKSCRQEQKGTKLSQRTSLQLLVDFSFKLVFKRHLFILSRREYISRHYNANDSTHFFLRIVVVGVGVWVCRRNGRLYVSHCPRSELMVSCSFGHEKKSLKTGALPTL